MQEQDKLLKILKIKIDAMNRNVDNLNYLNGELEKNSHDLNYIQNMVDLFKENDVLNFDMISKEEFDKILSMLDSSVLEIFNDKTCNYQGIIYIIQGIRQGISLELTNEQKNAILSFIEGMREKIENLTDIMDNLSENKQRLPETDLSILLNDLETYKNIISKLENNLYLIEIEDIVSALDFSNASIEEKNEIFEFILKYNAAIYSLKNENKEEKEEILEEEKLPEFKYDEVNLPKIEDFTNTKDSHDEVLTPSDDKMEYYEPFQIPITDDSTWREYDARENNLISFESNKPEEENLEDNKEVNESVPTFTDQNSEPNELNTIELEDIINKIDARLKEIEENEKKEAEAKLSNPEEVSTFQVPEFDELDLEESKKENITSETALDEILSKYELQGLNISNTINIHEVDSILQILEENKILDFLKKKNQILKMTLSNTTSSELLEIFDLIKENLSLNQENYQTIIEIFVETMPILFTNPEVMNTFKNNIEFFKGHQINLINLFDNYRELFLLDYEVLVKNYSSILKYGLTLTNDNVKYLLYNKHVLENLDYYIEAVGYEKGFLGKEMFDGLDYITKHPYKLNFINRCVLMKLRYSTDNGQKIYGSKPGILAGEIANPKVDILNISNDYKDKYFNGEYGFIDRSEMKDFMNEIKTTDDFSLELDENINKLDEKYKKSDLRYKFDNILISRMKTIRVYNFLRKKGMNSKNALLVALTYNSVLKKEEYLQIENIVNDLVEGGN